MKLIKVNLRITLYIFSLLFVLTGCKEKKESTGQQIEKPKILFIVVDDLRTGLACYGDSSVRTPHINKLADEGLVFENAYCQVPVCGASRVSFLSGLRPSSTRFKNYYTRHDEDAPGIVSLPGHFKNNGYTSLSRGKVYHHIDDALDSWSETPWDSIVEEQTWRDYVVKENISLQNDPQNMRGPAYECAEVEDNAYRDGKFADKAIQDFIRFKETGEPFFLALGFVKPHLPFNAPKKYWDLYDENLIQLAANPHAPLDAPDQALHTFGELRNYFNIPKKGAIPDSLARKLIHGYYASTSYTDAMIGKVLYALDTIGLSESTVVVLLSDHGWHLGEHGLWCKHCNFDKVLRVPLIIKSPTHSAERTAALTELIDLYPTLCDLCGIEKPQHLEGKSLESVMQNPKRAHKEAIFSRFQSGETVVNYQFAFTEWYTNYSMVTARMLYNHLLDPHENINVAEESGNAEIVKELSNKLELNRRSILKSHN